MTPREEQAFLVGMIVGTAMMAYRQQHELAALDKRLQRVERWLPRAFRVLRRLIPAGQRNGHRLYRIGQ
jgi:hypothetical protein